MMLAVAGKTMSGVTVAQIRQSISSGDKFCFAINSSTALTAMSLLALPGSRRILRSTIPVRERIHSSLVSTIFSKSKLVSLVSGTYPPTAVIIALFCMNIFIILGKYHSISDNYACPRNNAYSAGIFGESPPRLLKKSKSRQQSLNWRCRSPTYCPNSLIFGCYDSFCSRKICAKIPFPCSGRCAGCRI